MIAEPMLRRPRLALPFTVLTEPDTVRLVAGEDFRYTLQDAGLERWLPGLLARCDGRSAVEALLQELPAEIRPRAAALLAELYGERVLIDGDAAEAHAPVRVRLAPEGDAAWRGRLESPAGSTAAIPVLCQDRLDYEAAADFQRRCRAAGSRALWVTTGPMTRGYVSPVFLPDAGPCLGCLVRHFRRLSPAPELYDALAAHTRAGGALVPVPFSEAGLEVLAALARWKAELLAEPIPPAALWRLHVLEADTLEVGAHAVRVDPECPVCGGEG